MRWECSNWMSFSQANGSWSERSNLSSIALNCHFGSKVISKLRFDLKLIFSALSLRTIAAVLILSDWLGCVTNDSNRICKIERERRGLQMGNRLQGLAEYPSLFSIWLYSNPIELERNLKFWSFFKVLIIPQVLANYFNQFIAWTHDQSIV